MHQKSDLNGITYLLIGNNFPLSGTHARTTTIYNPQRKLNLTNILCALSITKKLLSISQLTKDNVMSVAFFDDHCVIKDLITKAKLLQGVFSNGLY